MSDGNLVRPPSRTQQRPAQRRVIYTGENRFKLDESKIPPDMAYAWKRISIAGQADEENQILFEMNGWTPVPASRHPELAGRNATDLPIRRGGLMLVEQPKEWSDESRALDEFAAKHVVEEQIQRVGLAAKRNGAKGVTRTKELIGETIE